MRLLPILYKMPGRWGQSPHHGKLLYRLWRRPYQGSLQPQHGHHRNHCPLFGSQEINDKVSFILDIGGQDMKAIFVDHGVLNRMELNESCSSGCGTFLQTFAKGLNYSVSEFADLACKAQHPCDLGTRCTVFMNSKVKQSLREGVTSADIAAGLAYSVVKNCLYKVLKLKSPQELGNEIVLQGAP